MTKTYQEMIQDALLTLGDGGKGSTRQALWKVIQTKYPQEDSQRGYRLFMVRLKKLCENPDIKIDYHHKNKSRFVIGQSLRDKIKRQKEKGVEVTSKIFTTSATTKASKKKQKADKKAKKEKEVKSKRKQASKQKAKGKGKGKGKNAKAADKGKSTKQKM